MGNTLSVEEKIYKTARDNDAAQLQAIIQQLRRQGADLPRYLEHQDVLGQTALIIAAARGNTPCVDLLLRHGANVHHFSRRQHVPAEGTSALHECVARGHLQVAELLLQYGANPFIENARGLTSVDIAINKGYVSMVRCLELRSFFTGTLQLKIPKFMGLGAEWKPRWCVIMPRYQFPREGLPAQERVARTLLVCYKAPDQCLPVCKVWLDGAVARSVVGSRGSGVLQCALSLHRNHALANGAHMTGDASVGYTMHLRPVNGTGPGTLALRKFMEIVNGATRSPVAAPQQRPAGAAPGPSQPRPLASASQPQLGPPPARPPAHRQSESDEDIARKLQQKYDAEMAEYVRLHPDADPKTLCMSLAFECQCQQAHARAGSASNPGTPSAYPAVNPASPPPSTPQSPATGALQSIPSAPMYPTINAASSSVSLMDAPVSGPPHLTAPLPQANGAASHSPEWYRTNMPTAAAPPPSATIPPAQPTQATGAAAAVAAAADDDDEAGECVICLAAKATAGFLHGESVHKCCCRECAINLRDSAKPDHPICCPLCRQPIQHVVLNFY